MLFRASFPPEIYKEIDKTFQKFISSNVERGKMFISPGGEQLDGEKNKYFKKSIQILKIGRKFLNCWIFFTSGCYPLVHFRPENLIIIQ